MSIRIAAVGDFQPDNVTHQATTGAYAHAAAALGLDAELIWVPTDTVSADASARLAGFDGILAAPASPYASMDGALAAIRHARERGVPFTGT